MFVSISICECKYNGKEEICVVNHETQAISYHNGIAVIRFSDSEADTVLDMIFEGAIWPLSESISDGQKFAQVIDASDKLPESVVALL